MKKIVLSKKIKIILICALILLFIICGLIITKALLSTNKTDTTTYSVRSELYENVIEIAGTISAAEEQTLQALSDGTVLGVYVNKGDKIKKGDLIIQLDDTEQRYNLADIDNQITTAKISGSKKELELLQTKRISILQKVENRKVVATFDGIIADLDVAVGDYMEAKDSVGTLINVDYLTADVEVAETDVIKLKAGQKVEFTFPAYPDQTIYGYVVSWPAIGEVTSRGASIVNAKVRIDEYPKEILPNFSFTGKIQITEPETNIIVERYAVAYKDGQAYVELAKNNETIEVKVRPYNKEYVKVLEGLRGGEILKAQSSPKKSGTNKNKKNTNSKDKNSNMNGLNGPGSSKGAGGPPPGGF